MSHPKSPKTADARNPTGLLPPLSSAVTPGSVEDIVEAKKKRDPLAPSERGMERASQRLDALVLKALSREPASRHPTMGHFLFELRTVRDMLDLRQPDVAQTSAHEALAASSASRAVPAS